MRSPLALYEGCKVLLVEDDALQALGFEQGLRDLGCQVLGPVPSAREAFALLRQERPNLALLDMMLRDGIAYAVVDQLAGTHVPFAMVTGIDSALLDRPSLRGVPLLPKPCPIPQLHASVRRLFRIDLDHRLDRTHQLVAQVWQTIDKQVRAINRLAIGGHDTSLAEQLLQTYERTLAILEEQRDRLERESERQKNPAACTG
jgi:DNA-binding response OmpR family regulator